MAVHVMRRRRRRSNSGKSSGSRHYCRVFDGVEVCSYDFDNGCGFRVGEDDSRVVVVINSRLLLSYHFT